MDIRSSQDGPLATTKVFSLQPPGDPPLAEFDLISYLGIHSKTLLVLGQRKNVILLIRPNSPRVFEFFHAQMIKCLSGVRLAKV
jgi:hypothetical protein